MIYNDIEYRILKDAAEKHFKVEIKDTGFMGFEKWKELKREYCSSFINYDWYTLENISPAPHTPPTWWTETALFSSCEKAKGAVEMFAEQQKVLTGWTECSC